MTKLIKNKKRVTLSYHTGMRQWRTHWLKLDRRQQRFLFSNDDRVPQNMLLSIAKNVILRSKTIFLIAKNVILRSKTIFLTVGNAVLRFFKNLESGSPGYVRAHSVSSLTWTPISFFVCWIYYCLLCRISFFFLSIFDHLPIGII